jgi:hypothetical protein
MEAGRALLHGAPADLMRAMWPHPTVVLDAENRELLDTIRFMPGVLTYTRHDGAATAEVQTLDLVPDLVDELLRAGARVTEVAPHRPTLEELYMAARQGRAGRAEVRT